MDLLVFRADKQIGPFSQEQIASMLEAGLIEPTDLAWHEGLADWTPLNQIFDLSPPAPEPEAAAPPMEAAPPEPEAPEPEVAPQRPRPPDGLLAHRPAQPVPVAQPAAPVAVPVARPQQPRGAVPVRAGASVVMGRTVAMPAAARAGVPVAVGRTMAMPAAARAGVPMRGAGPALAQAGFVHSGQPGSFGARLLAFMIDTVLVSIAASLIAWPLSYLMGGGIEMPKQSQRASQGVSGSASNGRISRPPGPPTNRDGTQGGRPKQIQRPAQDENMDPEEAMSFLTSIVAMAGRVVIMQVIILWLYFALMESSAKQGTLGKQWCGLMVTNLDGNRIGFGRASGRFFGKYVSALILYIGFLMCLWTEKKQCLHDIMAGAQVLKRGA